MKNILLIILIGILVMIYSVRSYAQQLPDNDNDCLQIVNGHDIDYSTDDHPCVTITPSEEVSPSPTATPSATPIPQSINNSTSSQPNAGSSATVQLPGTPSCTIGDFPKPYNLQFLGKKNGRVYFKWVHSIDTEVEKQSIAYGFDKNNLQWGIDNLPATQETFDAPVPDGTIWLQVTSYKGFCTEKTEVIDP